MYTEEHELQRLDDDGAPHFHHECRARAHYAAPLESQLRELELKRELNELAAAVLEYHREKLAVFSVEDLRELGKRVKLQRGLYQAMLDKALAVVAKPAPEHHTGSDRN